MLRQLLVGIAVSACNIGLHALVMTAVVRVARSVTATERSGQARLLAVMIATVSVLMLAHIAEVGVWALAYALVDAAPSGADVLDFAFVNYTTLGYGNVDPGGALAAARANDGDERRADVRLVDRRYFRGAATGDALRRKRKGVRDRRPGCRSSLTRTEPTGHGRSSTVCNSITLPPRHDF